MAVNDNFPKITSEQFPYDMGPWLVEKSENALKAFIELIKLLSGNIPDKKRFEENPLVPFEAQQLTLEDEVNETFQGIAWDLTKIYAFSNGAAWDISDRDLILDKLDDGLEELQVKYGLMDKTKKQEQKKRCKIFVNEIKRLLDGDRSPNRTLLHALFEDNRKFIDKTTIQGHFLANIENELEKVTDGVLDWSDFIVRAGKYLDML